jgi:cytochrome P450
VVQPLFSRRHVTAFGPAMTEAAQRLTARWDSLAEGPVISVAGQMSGLALDIVGQALFGIDLSGDADARDPDATANITLRPGRSLPMRLLRRR